MSVLLRAARWASAAAAVLTVHTVVNLRTLRRPPDTADRADGTGSLETSVLIPARNEAARIGPCLSAVLASRGIDFEVLVLDDESTDGTAGVARRAAAGDERVQVLTGSPPPPGWLGKSHACAQLAEAARGTVLVFLDADVWLAPDGLAKTVTLVQRTPLDLVSPYPHQVTDGVATRLMQPLLQWSWLTFLPLVVAERSSHSSLIAANGQLLACDAASYREVGGHGAVRDAVLEDVELAHAFKRAGYRAGVVDGTEVAVCQMYTTAAELVDGYTKSLWAAFGSPAGAVAVTVMLCWLYVLPPVAALRMLRAGRRRDAVVPALGYAAGVAGRVLTARRTGAPPSDAFGHPLSIVALGALTGLSWWRRVRNQLSWRGRALPGRN